MAKQQKFRIRISGEFDAPVRRAMGKEAIDFIIGRSKSGKDKRGNKFPKYSKGYENSLDFRNAGKTKGKVDLTLSREMLNSMKLLKHGQGFLEIGYNKGDKRNNGVAEGNIRGTYGKKRGNSAKARDFLGIQNKDLNKIKSKYPIDDLKDARQRAKLVQSATREGTGVLDSLVLRTEVSDGN